MAKTAETFARDQKEISSREVKALVKTLAVKTQMAQGEVRP